jgi:hypothetical protein
MKRAAQQCYIPDPFHMLIQEITHRLEACKRECVFYQEHGKQFRRKQLKNQKQIAQEQEDEEAFNKISAIIQREHQQIFWCKLNYLMGKKRTRSAMAIQVKGQGGVIMEHTTQDTVKQSIFSKVHKKWYTLAGEAPICKSTLSQDFRYTTSTPASRAVLNGTYVAPEDSIRPRKSYLPKLQPIIN